MSFLEKEILKFERKGFKVAQKRTLKHGVRVFLKKGGGLGGLLGYDAICLYYIDGDSNIDNLRETLKDYVKYYEGQGFDTSDRGLLIFSGDLDEKLFKDVKKVMISNEDIRGTIKAASLSQGIAEKPIMRVESKRPVGEPHERMTTRHGVPTDRISLQKVVDAIKSTPLIPQPKEKGYEAQLYTALHSKGFPVDYESQRRGARFDLVLGEIAVEIKVVKSASIFDTLYGQVSRYHDQFSKVIIVLIDQFRNPSILNKESERLKKISPGNIDVIVK
jgi:hypothetical protein